MTPAVTSALRAPRHSAGGSNKCGRRRRSRGDPWRPARTPGPGPGAPPLRGCPGERSPRPPGCGRRPPGPPAGTSGCGAPTGGPPGCAGCRRVRPRGAPCALHGAEPAVPTRGSSCPLRAQPGTAGHPGAERGGRRVPPLQVASPQLAAGGGAKPASGPPGAVVNGVLVAGNKERCWPCFPAAGCDSPGSSGGKIKLFVAAC